LVGSHVVANDIGWIVLKFLEDPTRRPDTSCIAKSPPLGFATAWEATGPQTAP
jgi:hypothetical protein